MEKYKKFLAKLTPELRRKLIKTIALIAENNFRALDIKMLHAKYCLYRYRIGKLRVLFQKTENGNKILDVGFRGGVYKNL